MLDWINEVCEAPYRIKPANQCSETQRYGIQLSRMLTQLSTFFFPWACVSVLNIWPHYLCIGHSMCLDVRWPKWGFVFCVCVWVHISIQCLVLCGMNIVVALNFPVPQFRFCMRNSLQTAKSRINVYDLPASSFTFSSDRSHFECSV